jgi:serine/threonine protein kinase
MANIMIYCPNCGKEKSKEDEVCPNCGFDFTSITPDPQKSKGKEDETTLDDGEIIGNRYKILGILGKGGMGRVYKALDLELEELVALKMIETNIVNEEMINRFKREIKISRTVTHENVCRIYDMGEADGKKFISMQYIEGEDLKSYLKNRGTLKTEEAIPIFINIANALIAIHKKGIIHRDLKPANIMISKSGEAYITDFGIAKGGGAQDLTKSGSTIGTPHYMSPEQIQGKNLTTASDIYSFGVMMYHLITGKTPFKADSSFSLAMKHVNEQPKPPSNFAPNIPKDLEKLILDCMSKNPSKRPPNGATIKDNLSSIFRNAESEEVKSKENLDYAPTVAEIPIERFSTKSKLIITLCTLVLIASLIALFTGTKESSVDLPDRDPNDKTRDESHLTDTSGMLKIKGGIVEIGTDRFSEDQNSPVRQVKLDDFYIDKYEVTNIEYDKFIEKTGYPPPSSSFWPAGHYPTGEDKLPVIGISQNDAEAYCSFYKKRLPTEEEWEYAARTNSSYYYPWGNEYVEGYANIGTGYRERIGSKKNDKNGFGIYDLTGNVSEWTSKEVKRPDETGRQALYHVVRGGSFSRFSIKNHRLTRREFIKAEDESIGYKYIGFRCVSNSPLD